MNSMAKHAIVPIGTQQLEIDIYSNKSSLILFWLLAHHHQSQKEGFSINELARVSDVSIGQVHKVIKQLEFEGLVKAKGLRTNKIFYLQEPGGILLKWIPHYHVMRKVRSKGFAPTSEIEKALVHYQKSDLLPALHSSCRLLFGIKITNVKGSEFYLKDWATLSKIVAELGLQELDRGYEILFMNPYYSALVLKMMDLKERSQWVSSYEILTLLDLCNYPLRGLEQAETLFRKSAILKSICSWKEVESASR